MEILYWKCDPLQNLVHIQYFLEKKCCFSNSMLLEYKFIEFSMHYLADTQPD